MPRTRYKSERNLANTANERHKFAVLRRANEIYTYNLNQTLKKKFVGVNYIFYFMFDDSKIDRYLSTTSVTLNIQYFPLTFHSFFIRTRLNREYSRVILSNCFATSFKTTFVLFRKFSQTSKYHKTLCKVWRLKKQTTFAFVQFRTISGHFLGKYVTIFHKTWSFFGIYIDIFSKTEIQTVILKCLVCLNLTLLAYLLSKLINEQGGIFHLLHEKLQAGREYF